MIPSHSKQPTLKLIGISGKKQHGKDTVATILSKVYGLNNYTSCQINLADSIYEEVARALQSMRYGDFSNWTPTKTIIEHIKANKTSFRLLLQWYGNDYIRNVKGDKYWINKWLLKVDKAKDKYDVILCSDVRFLNEADMIKQCGGSLIRVDRANQSDDTHASETELDNYEHFDHTIDNNGTLEQLSQTVKQLITKL